MNMLLAFAIVVFLSRVALSTALMFDVSPKVLKRSGDFLSLTWAGLESPTDLDWIGIYTPADSLDDNFIGYIMLSSSPDWSIGNGSVEIPLVNMRTPYQFRIFQGVPANISKDTRFDEDGNALPSTAMRLAVTDNIEFKSFNEPTQIHLSLTSRAGEMRIMFVTKDPLECFILYGLGKDSLDLTVATEARTYRQDDMCDEPANTTVGWRDPGYIRVGVIRELKTNKRYFYQVGSKEGGWSDIYSFVSPPAEGDETDALLFGDMGTDVPYRTYLWTQAQSINTVKWLQRDIEALRDKPTFISHIGDISYARGYAWLWDEFFSRIQPLAARVPYIVCIGNHEYDWPLQPWKPDWAAEIYGTDGGGECGVPYSLRFQMPGNSSLATGTRAPATQNLYFSITFGVVHFVYISTETDFLPGSEQYEFLEKDLQVVDRSKVPFLVVLGHRPMYTSNHEVRDFPLRLQMLEHLEPMLVKYRVNLVLWGHVHKYERTCAVKNFTCADASMEHPPPVNVVIGMAGQDWQPQWAPRDDHPSYPIFPQPGWSLYRSEEFGYVRLHATKDFLKLSYVGNQDGEVHDYVEIPASSTAKALSISYQVQSSAVSWLTGSLWFALGSVFALVTVTAYHRRQKRDNMRGDWRRLEMSSLDSEFHI